MPASPEDPAHPPSPSDAIRWLHLSDLHLGCRGREIWWQAHDELKTAIRDGVRRLGAPDLILFTGDLTFSGSKEQFRLVDQFLDDLLGWIRDAGIPETDHRPLLVPEGRPRLAQGFNPVIRGLHRRTIDRSRRPRVETRG